jgi:Holliday junction resolvase RusA-like endonuclease
VTWSITVPGRPRSKGNSHRHWNPVTVNALAAAKYHIRTARPREPFAVPVRVDVVFCFAIPKGKRKTLRSGDAHGVRPDRGNCLKLIEDALTGAVVVDDSLIASGDVSKIWHDVDETRVTVVPLA